jgi:hypothetical protein
MLARGNTTQKHNTITETKSQTTSGVSSDTQMKILNSIICSESQQNAMHYTHFCPPPQTILQFSQMIASEKPV